MCTFRSQINYSGLISILYIWVAVGSNDLISLSRTPNGDSCITNSSTAMYYTTVGNGVEKAGYYYHPPITFDCDFETPGATCNTRFVVGGWQSVHSFNHANTPIFDYRWEKLPIQELPFKTNSGKKLSLSTLIILYDAKSFRVTISLKGPEPHFLLCDKEDVTEANCYWFVLQGWNKRFTVLRRCEKGDIKGLYPDGSCKHRMEEVKHPEDIPLYINNTSWTHITIERIDRNLYLKLQKEDKEDTIIHYTEKKEMFELKYLLGHRKDEKVYCKVHGNRYMQITKISDESFTDWFSRVDGGFCFAFLVNTCQYCTIILQFVDTTKVIFEEVIPPTNGYWVLHKVVLDESNAPHIKVRMRTLLAHQIANAYWAFDNFRECHKEEYRLTQKNGKKISECQLLNSDQKVGIEDDISYKTGETCIACNIFNKLKSCKKTKICENMAGSSKCFCLPGCTGQSCQEDCHKGTYGLSCVNKCGFCYTKGQCNAVDGSCLCDSFFEGKGCLQPKSGVYLGKAPKVIGSNVNSCQIEWKVHDYIGKFEPAYYLTQYMDTTQIYPQWSDFNKMENIDSIGRDTITNLQPGHEYRIRILLSYDLNKIKELSSHDLPFAVCSTTCNGLNDDNLDIHTTSQSFTMKIILSENSCDLNSYEYKLKNEAGEEILKGNVISPLFIDGLPSYTKFTIDVYSTSQTIIKKFSTTEGVPSEVQKTHIEESTTNSIKLRWENPKHANGVIEKFKIIYQRIQRISCFPIIPETAFEIDTTENTIELRDLVAYSVYQVQIFAFNRLYSSGGSKMNFETQGLEYFTEDDDLKEIVLTHDTSEHGASLIFTNIHCGQLQGPLIFSTKYRCISEWCTDTSEKSLSILWPEKNLDLRWLQVYCEYNYDVFYCRNENYCQKWNNGSFSTKASVPTSLSDFSVTAIGDNSISLRWLRPYPPTGILESYRITTECLNCATPYLNMQVFAPAKCSIWPEYDCFQITEKIFNNYKHSVEVSAKNEGNRVYTRVGFMKEVLIKEKTPDKPYNLIAVWHLNNTMEIFWNHPNKTNGILQNFHIDIALPGYLPLSANFPVYQEKLTYSYKFSAPFPSALEFYIRITAYNNKYASEVAEIKESSYPMKPNLTSSQITIENYTETTITLSFDGIQSEINNTLVGHYLVVIIDDNSQDVKDPNMSKLEAFMNITIDSVPKFRIATIIKLNALSANGISFTIGDGTVVKESAIQKTNIVNKPLQKGKYYNIIVMMLNEFKGKYRHISVNITALTGGNPDMTTPPSEKREGEEGSSGGSFVYILLVLLVLILLIVIGVTIKRKNLKFVRPTISLEKMLDSTRVVFSSKEADDSLPLDAPDTVVIASKPVMKVKPKLPIIKSTNPPNSATEIHSRPIKITEFEEYVKTSLENGELEKQHALFPRGQTQPWKTGSTKINKPKNRYNNLIAYDHSRVILEKVAGDDNSEYINANYIHGYNIERAYIATQGPKSTTVTDFWRMIWQENVGHIVMVANVYEAGKKKVEQYWPNINEELTFQDIVVQYQSMQLFANYEYRVFQVTRGKEVRKVEQLHFTTWPDHGIPLYPQSLVPFLRKLLKIPLSSTTPIVVHCSAGVGRTGTILLADISLRMAAKQGVVDMLNNLQKLREQRPNMVDNVEQYKLAHLVVLESVMGLQTSIPCNDDMDEAVQRLIRTQDYKIQINYLLETEWKDDAMKTISEINDDLPNYPEKNRFPHIIPENQGRLFLTRYPHDDESSAYINAVQVDGFRCPGRFFVTQQPMPNTVGDFWRFVSERRINVIVSLNEIDQRERTSCKFWPTAADPEFHPVDFLLVKFSNVTELEYYNIYSVHVWIKNKSEKEKIDVQIVAFKRWPAREIVPTSSEEFLSFYEEADAISRRSNNVIVTCFDGATASGAYVALSFIIEKMKLEHECDVCLAVRTIRHNRKQFVTHEAQFLFLYDCAVKYINGFQPYANFQNQ